MVLTTSYYESQYITMLRYFGRIFHHFTLHFTTKVHTQPISTFPCDGLWMCFVGFQYFHGHGFSPQCESQFVSLQFVATPPRRQQRMREIKSHWVFFQFIVCLCSSCVCIFFMFVFCASCSLFIDVICHCLLVLLTLLTSAFQHRLMLLFMHCFFMFFNIAYYYFSCVTCCSSHCLSVLLAIA